MSKDLAQIRRDYPFSQSLDDFRISFDKEKAKSLFEKYAFKSLMPTLESLELG